MTMNNRIMIQDIYDVVNRLEDKLDKRLEKVEGRIDSLEDFKGRITGISVVVSVFAGTVSGWIWERLSGK